MYRKSSKGNPYHDSKGRFTSANGKATNKSTGKTEDRPVEIWAGYGERHYKDDIQKEYKVEPKDKKETKELWQKVDADKAQVARTDGRRFYHNRSINRETHAKNVSNVTIPKGMSLEERKKYVEKAFQSFKAENSVAIKKGGVVRYYRNKNSNEIKFQVVEASKLRREVDADKRTVRNTSTSMKPFSGFTVEFTKGNADVRSCKRGASKKEITEAIDKFCKKHQKVLSEKNTCIKVWRGSDGRVFFMPTWKFDNKAEAIHFAEKRGGKVINQDDGSMD